MLLNSSGSMMPSILYMIISLRLPAGAVSKSNISGSDPVSAGERGYVGSLSIGPSVILND